MVSRTVKFVFIKQWGFLWPSRMALIQLLVLLNGSPEKTSTARLYRAYSKRICQYTRRDFYATMGFSLNDFLWIQGIQWIMMKSKTGMATRGITQLVVGVLPVIVIQSVFSLLPRGRYLLPLTTPNSYQPRDGSGKFSFTTTASNISIVKHRMSLVTILPLDLVIVHWILWIQRKSFRENSNVWLIYSLRVAIKMIKMIFWANSIHLLILLIRQSPAEVVVKRSPTKCVLFCHCSH